LLLSLKRKVTKETSILGVGYVILDTLILAARPYALVETMGFDSQRELRALVADGSDSY